MIAQAIRSYDEIVERCRNTKSLFGFDMEVLLQYVPYEQARPFLKEDTDPIGWDAHCAPLTRDRILEDMASYMKFAWTKVEDHRGISAGRSVEKMEMWLWLLSDDDTMQEVEAAPYQNYGAPKLAVICRRYDLPIPEDEDVQLMIQGKMCRSCQDGYESGCG